MHQNSQIAPRSCCSQAHAASQPSATPVRVSRRCKSSKIGDSAVPVVEERVLQGPLPTARIENPMRNLAQSTEITDIEPFSYPACVEEKRFQKLTGVTGILVAQHPFGQQVRTGEHQECVLAGDTNGNQCWSPHSHTYASRQMEPAVIPSRSRPALASSHRRRRKNLAHPKCVQQPSNRRGAPSTVLIGRWRGLWH